MNDRQVHAVILAGGSGSRLWPLSRQYLPKQFLSLDGEASLLQTTINRLSPLIKAKNVLIVTQEAHAKGEAYHALLPYQTLFEPVARNTAPLHIVEIQVGDYLGEDDIQRYEDNYGR